MTKEPPLHTESLAKIRQPEYRALALLRQLISAAEQSPQQQTCLSTDSLIYSVARKIIDDDEGHRRVQQTALMALRDLIWRIDTAKFLLRDAAKTRQIQELSEILIEILDTSDVDSLVRGREAGASAGEPELVHGN
ncbi:hypothetical protein [Pelagibacterium montanilacus]|uniref:hypothetical protein n=1 Tax=Pelagibacterium montanilacus TaxID=2185280 RepID=UPI000F8DA064|nr:hypothetical protein [Pelagibacterium montanilacus]